MAQSFAHGNHSHTQRKVKNRGAGRTGRDQARPAQAQVFLADADAVGRVVAAARPAGLVVEPGAGHGALTRALAEHAAKVVAYETDVLLAGKLASRTRGDARIEVVRGDLLAANAPREPFAVVGVVPGAITARVVDWCLRAPSLTSATLVTEAEYARTMTGGSGRWDALTVRTWPRFGWSLAGHVGRDGFHPVAAADAAVLRIERRPDPLLPADRLEEYHRLVEPGFGQAGGTLLASLSGLHPADRLDAAFAAAGLDHRVAAEAVQPAQWLTLAGHLR
ncbi:ribosomal RNA small subunit methyltransferase A [Microtetraspora niveoalba]|uniref:ribosomal RNA small subunit methyltransferase A n=1 Tax=Microtetraspora niveoalba TaxID=46175 RepID=UPI00083205C4|nr:rRNA adenine N(6)-methyltransferase family protein [Microtetraspora niveoalba]